MAATNYDPFFLDIALGIVFVGILCNNIAHRELRAIFSDLLETLFLLRLP